MLISQSKHMILFEKKKISACSAVQYFPTIMSASKLYTFMNHGNEPWFLYEAFNPRCNVRVFQSLQFIIKSPILEGNIFTKNSTKPLSTLLIEFRFSLCHENSKQT